MSSDYYTNYKPFADDISSLDIETLDNGKLKKWIESGKSQFGLGTAGLILMQSLGSEEGRRQMVVNYGPLIQGFPKEPSITVCSADFPNIDIIPDHLQAQITPEIVNQLSNFVLPEKYPAALNKPQVPPNDSIQCAGPVSEAALMYFNTILPRYYATLTRTMMVALMDPTLGEDYGRKICGDFIGIIDATVIKGNDMQTIVTATNARIREYAKRTNYDMVHVNDTAARLYADGNHHMIVRSTDILYEMLKQNDQQLYIMGVIDTLYRLVVNQVKVYKDDSTAFELPRGSSGEICNIGVISMPSGIPQSVTIQPVDRLDVQREDPSVVYNNPAEIRLVEKLGGPTYRLKMGKTSFTLSGVDRYTPQLFLKPSCRMLLDIEFVYGMAEGVIDVYKVHSYNGIRSIDPYDPSLIRIVRDRLRFQIISRLGPVKRHTSYWLGRNYSNHLCPVVCCAMAPAREKGVKLLVPSDSFNMIHPKWCIPFPNRTKVKKKVQSNLMHETIGIDFSPPIATEWSLTFNSEHGRKQLTDNAMDYEFYSYSYTMAYDLTGAQACDVDYARNFSHAQRTKPVERYNGIGTKRGY